jgi:hypothetical protein
MKKWMQQKVDKINEAKERTSQKAGAKSQKKLDVGAIKAQFLNFNAICEEVAKKSRQGAELLQAIIADPALFGHYIDSQDYLKRIMGMCANQIDDMKKNIMSDAKASNFFLNDLDYLVKTNSLFKQYSGANYEDDLIQYALSNKALYSQILCSEKQLNDTLNQLSQFQKTILAILTNPANIDIVAKTLGKRSSYCEFAKKYESCRPYFVKLAHTSEKIFDELGLKNKENFIEFVGHFSEADKPLMKLILTDKKKFDHAFGTFHSIYEFCKNKQVAHHQKKLIDHAMANEEYVRRNIGGIYSLSQVQKVCPEEDVKQLESLVLKDPKWVQSMIHSLEDIPMLSNPAFTQLRKAYFTYLYLNPSEFWSWAGLETKLKKMIEIAPDQEIPLRLYHQLYTLDTGLSNPNTFTLQELKQYVQNCLNKGEIKCESLVSLQTQVQDALKDETAHYHDDIKALSDCLEHCLAPSAKVATLLHQDTFPKPKEPSGTKTKTEAAHQPTIPGRTSSN